MKTAIQIGGINKKTAIMLSDYVTLVFKKGKKYEMESEVIQKALDLFNTVSSADHASITNCNFVSKKKK